MFDKFDAWLKWIATTYDDLTFLCLELLFAGILWVSLWWSADIVDTAFNLFSTYSLAFSKKVEVACAFEWINTDLPVICPFFIITLSC